MRIVPTEKGKTMPEIKLKKKLIYAGDAHRAILEADPKLAYCIERIKAVDAEVVVRCKDCKHYMEYPLNKVDKRMCCYVHILTPHFMPEDGFCSYGERKDNA